jgi:hypothetical protein
MRPWLALFNGWLVITVAVVPASIACHNLEIDMIKKQDSDPFLAQASLMLVILLVMFAIGGESASLDHLVIASR